MHENLTKTIAAMFDVMADVRAQKLTADEGHAIVRAGAVIVKAHEVDVETRLADIKVYALGARAARIENADADLGETAASPPETRQAA